MRMERVERKWWWLESNKNTRSRRKKIGKTQMLGATILNSQSLKLVNIVFAMHLNYVHIHPFHNHMNNLKRFLPFYHSPQELSHRIYFLFSALLFSFHPVWCKHLWWILRWQVKGIAQYNLRNGFFTRCYFYRSAHIFFAHSFIRMENKWNHFKLHRQTWTHTHTAREIESIVIFSIRRLCFWLYLVCHIVNWTRYL